MRQLPKMSIKICFTKPPRFRIEIILLTNHQIRGLVNHNPVPTVCWHDIKLTFFSPLDVDTKKKSVVQTREMEQFKSVEHRSSNPTPFVVTTSKSFAIKCWTFKISNLGPLELITQTMLSRYVLSIKLVSLMITVKIWHSKRHGT